MASAFSGVTGWPSNETCPSSGRSRPSMSRSSVDLPQPLGPSNTLILPANAADVGSMIALAMKVITGAGANGGTVPPPLR